MVTKHSLNNWQTKRLGKICDLIKGKKPEIFVLKSNKPYLTAKVVRKTENPKFAAENCPSSVWVKKEDIVIIMDGSNSGEMFTGLEGALASTMGIVKYPKDLLTPKYLLHFLITHRENFTKSRTGSAIPHLNKEEFENLEIPLPPLPEQQRIVAIIDEAFAAIATAKENAEKNLQNARELFESYLQSVFANPGDGWKEKTVGEIAQCSLGKMLDKAKNRGEPKKYLRNLNVRWFEFDLDDLLQMRFTPEEQEKYTAVRGDVLICEGGYPGRAAIWNEDYPIYFQKALHRVRFDVPDHSKWFLYYLYLQGKNGDLKKYFSGTGIQHFTGEALHRFVLPVAPIEHIRSIVAKLDALSAETQKLEAIYQQKLADLDELKKSVLQKAFDGEL